VFLKLSYLEGVSGLGLVSCNWGGKKPNLNMIDIFSYELSPGRGGLGLKWDLHIIRDPSPFHLPTSLSGLPHGPKQSLKLHLNGCNNQIVISGQKEKRWKGKPCPFQLDLLPWGDVPEDQENILLGAY